MAQKEATVAELTKNFEDSTLSTSVLLDTLTLNPVF